MVWDLGANDGTFSRLATERGASTVAFDVDPVAVEKNYRRSWWSGASGTCSPLLLDLINPSPRSGWAHEERTFGDRGPVDLVLALALVHHLAIAHNLPLARIAEFLRQDARAGRTSSPEVGFTAAADAREPRRHLQRIHAP